MKKYRMIRVDEKTHKQAKIEAAKNDLSLLNYIQNAVSFYKKSQYKLNNLESSKN